MVTTGKIAMIYSGILAKSGRHCDGPATVSSNTTTTPITTTGATTEATTSLGSASASPAATAAGYEQSLNGAILLGGLIIGLSQSL